MIKTVLNIDGMSCGMCEAHVNDAIRAKFKVKKVTSSYKSGTTEIITENALNENELISALEQTGYKVTGVNAFSYEKKGFLFRHK